MGWSGIKDYGIGGKYSNPERDKEIRDKGKNLPKKRRWTKERLVNELEDCFDILKKILKDTEKINKGNDMKAKQETTRDTITMMNRVSDMIKLLYPEVAKTENVNLNYDVSSLVLQRLKKWKTGEGIQEIVEIDGKSRFSDLKDLDKEQRFDL